jgi:hypothetical protein
LVKWIPGVAVPAVVVAFVVFFLDGTFVVRMRWRYQRRSGVNVRILKIFSPKKLAILTQSTDILCQKLIIIFIFEKIANCFSPIKIAKNIGYQD